MVWGTTGIISISWCLNDWITTSSQVSVLSILPTYSQFLITFHSLAIKKMENSLLRMYLVNASSNGKQEKVQEFFEKLGSDLQNQPEWKDWFGRHTFLYFNFKINLFKSFFSTAFHKEPWRESFLYGLLYTPMAGHHVHIFAQPPINLIPGRISNYSFLNF